MSINHWIYNPPRSSTYAKPISLTITNDNDVYFFFFFLLPCAGVVCYKKLLYTPVEHSDSMSHSRSLDLDNFCSSIFGSKLVFF